MNTGLSVVTYTVGFHCRNVAATAEITGCRLEIDNKRIGRAARCLRKLMRYEDKLSYLLGEEIPWELIGIHNWF